MDRGTLVGPAVTHSADTVEYANGASVELTSCPREERVAEIRAVDAGIGSLIDDYRDRFDNAVIDLTIGTARDREIRNGEEFRIALEEIVKNVVTHAEQASAHVEVTVEDSETERTIGVEVADDGRGVPEAEWETVKTGTETLLRHANSTGLWLIYWAVTTFGRSVELVPNDPRGSVLALQVPVGADAGVGVAGTDGVSDVTHG